MFSDLASSRAYQPLLLILFMVGFLLMPRAVHAAQATAFYRCSGNLNPNPQIIVERANIFGEVIVYKCSDGTIQKVTPANEAQARAYYRAVITCESGTPENPLPHIWNCPNRAEAPQAANDPFGDGGGGDDRIRCDNGQEGVQLSNPVDVNGDGVPDECIPFNEDNEDLSQNPIIRFLGVVLNFVLGGVGLVIVAVLIFAGYRYMTSDGNPQAVSQAKKMIFLAVASLVGYFFTAALINWLIPGGIL